MFEAIARRLGGREGVGSQLSLTFLIQGFGAAAMLLAVVLLGFRFGPAEQGIFSRSKTELETIVGIGLLGLPQGFLYGLRTNALSIKRLIRVSVSVTGAGVVAAGVYAYFLRGGSVVPFFVVASGVMLLYGFLRGAVLALTPTMFFNLATAAPQVLLLLAVILVPTGSAVTVIYAASAFGLSYGLVTIWMAIRIARTPIADPSEEAPLGQLVSYSTATWVSAVATNVSLLLVTLYVDRTASPVTLGLYTSSVVLAQGLLTPINYSTPVIFKMWTGHHTRSAPPWRLATLVASPFVLGAFLTALAAQVIDAGSSGYAPLVDIVWIVMVIVAAETFYRVIAVQQMAIGRPWIQAIADISRILLPGALLFALHPVGFVTAVFVWGAGSVAALTIVVAWVRIASVADGANTR